MIESKKTYDLEERTFIFAKDIRAFLKKIKKNIINENDIRQLIRSSGSVGANYIEANESLGKKDFLMRIKISRKEAKESKYWLRLLDLNGDQDLNKEHNDLLDEVQELMNIFGSIYRKSESK